MAKEIYIAGSKYDHVSGSYEETVNLDPCPEVGTFVCGDLWELP